MDAPQPCVTVSRMHNDRTMAPTKRQALRRPLRLPLSLGRKLPAFTADVSRGGFQAELPQVFLPGSKVHGYFLVNEQEVAFRGTVAWAVPGNPMLTVYSRIGVSFDETPDALKPLLDARPKRIKLRR